MIVDLWHAIGGYFYDVFVQRLDWWAYIGIIAQALFTARFVVQWLASEKSRRSVIPISFWWMSLIGSTMLLVYFIWRRDIVGIIGQATGWVIYIRNLVLIRRSRS